MKPYHPSTAGVGAGRTGPANKSRCRAAPAAPVNVGDVSKPVEADLKEEVAQLKETVATLTAHVNFLLSFVGAVVVEPGDKPGDAGSTKSDGKVGSDILVPSYAAVTGRPSTQVSGAGVGVVTMREAPRM